MFKKLAEDSTSEESKKESKAEITLSQILGAAPEPELRNLTVI